MGFRDNDPLPIGSPFVHQTRKERGVIEEGAVIGQGQVAVEEVPQSLDVPPPDPLRRDIVAPLLDTLGDPL
jgi:hypothetical protein